MMNSDVNGKLSFSSTTEGDKDSLDSGEIFWNAGFVVTGMSYFPLSR